MSTVGRKVIQFTRAAGETAQLQMSFNMLAGEPEGAEVASQAKKPLTFGRITVAELFLFSQRVPERTFF